MTFEIEAVYENGALKPDRPLPLQEHQRVRIVVQGTESIAKRMYGVIGWKGDSETIQKFAMDQEFGVSESP